MLKFILKIIAWFFMIAFFGFGFFYDIINWSTLQSMGVDQFISANYTKMYTIFCILSFLFAIYVKIYLILLEKNFLICKKEDINYTREIPNWVNLETAYSSLYYNSNIKKKDLKKGIIGAFLLKWYYNDNIIITNSSNSVFNIDLKDGSFEKTKREQELYDMLKQASGSNNTLDSNELKTWSKKNINAMELWYSRLLFNSFESDLKQEAEILLGLKNFLLDYSLIDERSHIEVKVWESYLIYAQLLGITDKVNTEFKKLYPDDTGKLLQLDIKKRNGIQIDYIEVIIYILLIFSFPLLLTLLWPFFTYLLHFLFTIILD